MELKTIPLTQATPFVTGSGPAGVFRQERISGRLMLPGVALSPVAGQVIGLLEFDGFYASDVVREASSSRPRCAAVPTPTVLLDGVSRAQAAGTSKVIFGHHDGGLHR